VLREFKQTTQFIMITHSKRSMAAADLLYGVTMEESGVSKRLSVRFEDVDENGAIRGAEASSQAPRSAGRRGRDAA
jgi:chromosome segregation protein